MIRSSLLIVKEAKHIQRAYMHTATVKCAKFHRQPVRIYEPITEGIVAPRGSLAAIPKPKDVNGSNPYQKLKDSAELFRTVMGSIYTTKAKTLVAVEGGRLVDDALSVGLKPKYLFVLRSLKTYPEGVKKIVEDALVESEDASHIPEPRSGPEVHRIHLKVLQEWSAVETPPGIVGIFEKSSISSKLRESSEKIKKMLPVNVILDNIRDPGNLGSIIRTAAGIGCKLMLSKGCVDPWDMKTLRGGHGAQFVLPVKTGVSMENFHQQIDYPDLIPQSEDCENDNGTEANLLKKPTRTGIGIFLADSGDSDGDDEFGLPIVPYTSINYSSFQSIYLILGGETTGLSQEIRKSVKDLPSIYPDVIRVVTRVKIPMYFSVDSLNVANAFGIIGYEISRQFNNQ